MGETGDAEKEAEMTQGWANSKGSGDFARATGAAQADRLIDSVHATRMTILEVNRETGLIRYGWSSAGGARVLEGEARASGLSFLKPGDVIEVADRRGRSEIVIRRQGE